MCRAFFDRYGLSFCGLRYMNVYGPHQDQSAAYTGVIPIMLNKIDANEIPVINGDGSQAYDFIDVVDVARSNVLALAADTDDEFYNVGTGVQTSIKDLCELILELAGGELLDGVIWTGEPAPDEPPLPRPLAHVLELRARIIRRMGTALCFERGAVVSTTLPRVEPLGFSRDGFHASADGYVYYANHLLEYVLDRR